MSYQILAQKYRPQTFDDVIGQEAVTKTLKNSIVQERLANAYIFCGPRGVGKTSVARLLSKTVNCEQPPEKSPCNKCDSCREISLGNNIDVLEIDGASNRGIDEIRTLRENVKFSPSKGKFKIYIIDEVHMLTAEAFNALLKTLEEPPAHVRFIFATTEPHKVLPTIMSRCQRFDFKKIPPKLIFDSITGIAGKEKIDIDEKAAILIARSADGSLRDALVILDQMVSFSGKKILPDDVIELLGMVHKEKVFELSDTIIANDAGRVARVLDGLISDGKDPMFIANSLLGHYRDLMVLKTAGSPTADMAFTDDEMKTLKAQLEKLSLEEILYILQNLSHCLTLMKGASFARAPLEIALIRLTQRGSILSLKDILAKLENTEQPSRQEESGLSTGAASGVSSAAPSASPEVKKPVLSPENGTEEDPSEDNGDNELPAGDLGTTASSWKEVLKYIRNKKMSVFTYLNPARIQEFSKDKVSIGFGKEHAFNKEALEANGNKKVIEEAVNRVTGTSPRLEFVTVETPDEDPLKDEAAEAKPVKKETMKPVIEKAMDVFGGHVVRDHMEDQK